MRFNSPTRPLSLLSVVIPARDEEGCIASTIEHLHLELSLRSVPHEIVVVDEGSTDSTWQILQGEAAKIPTLRPIQNRGQQNHFFRLPGLGFLPEVRSLFPEV